MPPLLLAHVSDFHVSTFGDTMHDRARLVKRSVKPVSMAGKERFSLVFEEAGWRLFQDGGARGEKLLLLDPEGYSYPVPRPGKGPGNAGPAGPAARAQAL